MGFAVQLSLRENLFIKLKAMYTRILTCGNILKNDDTKFEKKISSDMRDALGPLTLSHNFHADIILLLLFKNNGPRRNGV